MGSRTVIAAAAAVLALAVGSWIVLRVGAPPAAIAPSPEPSPPLRERERAERSESGPSISTPTSSATSTSSASPTSTPTATLPAAPGSTPWEDVPFTERPEDLGGALGRAVADGVTDLREHLALCFSVEPESPRPPAGPEGDPEPPALELRLEARGDEVLVADALVDTYGPSLSLVTCARERVKGFRFPAPEAGGRRIRLGFPLQ